MKNNIARPRTSKKRILLGLLVSQICAAMLHAAFCAEYFYRQVKAGVVLTTRDHDQVYKQEFIEGFFSVMVITAPLVYILGFAYAFLLEKKGVKSFWAYIIASGLVGYILVIMLEQHETYKFLSIMVPVFLATLVYWKFFIKK